MPAYLTHAAVLIKMTEWLELLRAQIAIRRKKFTAAGKPMNALDDRFDVLAERALFYLREDPAAAPDVALPVTQIKNGVGSLLSKYALVGSLGPDLPAAGYILAMNQDWAWHTLHNGEPRRARKNAQTTTFVLKLLEQLEKGEKDGRLTPAQRRRGISYALGHLSHIAADVVLHPIAHYATKEADGGALDPLEHQLFEVAIDGQMIGGFFQRKGGPNDDQSWEDYYLEKGAFKADLSLLMGELSGAFKATYGSERPTAPVCGLSDPSKCGAPKFDTEFLMDAYRNTTNWAIDVGYDHGTTAWDVVSALLVLTSAAMSANSLASGTKSFSTITNTIFGANQTAIDELSATAAADWQRDGVGSWAVWRDIITKSISWSNYVALPFEWLFGGGKPMMFLTLNQAPKGIFGQNAGVDDSNPAIRTINDAGWGLKTVAFIALDEIAPTFTAKPWWKWLWFAVDILHDPLEYKYIKNESRKDNYSGDRLLRATWIPKRILAASNFLGNAVMMLWKASDGRRDGDNNRDAGTSGLDFIAPGVCALFVILIFVAPGNRWRNHFFFKTTKSHWPMSEGNHFPDRGFLRVVERGGKMTFAPATEFGTTTGRVRLFPDDKLTKEGTEEYYPDGGGDPGNVDGQAERDRAARAAAMIDVTDHEYPFAELLDHAARFAGLLSMAAVAYSDTAAPVRPHMTAVFKDWNLDFATVNQWKDLLEPSVAADMGILHAASLYTADLEKQVDAPNEVAVGRLRSAMGLTDIAGGVIADFTHKGVTVDLIDADTARAARLMRPGAVVLPNVDIDTPAPLSLATPLPSRAGDLDALKDDVINTLGNDLLELTQFRLRKPDVTIGPPTLRLHATDASRIRVFEKNSGAPDTWPVVLGFTSGGVKTEYDVPAASPDDTDYFIEVKGFAGDPATPAPTGPGPLSPAPFGSAGARVGSPVATDRRASEVWIEVIHKESGTEVPGVRDVALFGVAPLLLLSNLHKAERLYAAYLPDQFDALGTLQIAGNFPFISDLVRALQSDPAIAPRVKVRTVPAPVGTLDEFLPHQPLRAGEANEAGAIYIVDGLTYGTPDTVDPSLMIFDPWVQDEFEICYAHSPRALMHAVLHNPRKRELADFVDNELPSVDMGLFDGVNVVADSIDYGGNLEVSPPVSVAIAAPVPASMRLGAAGMEISPQPVSPLGKIILGEGTPFLFDLDVKFATELDALTVSFDLRSAMNGHAIRVDTTDTVEVRIAGKEWLLNAAHVRQTLLIRHVGGKLKVHAARLARTDYKRFLEAQRAQPIVTVDTSWLSVGHVDEILIFVPATGGGKNFRLLMASSQLAVDIFDAAKGLNDPDPVGHPLTNTFRGQRWLEPLPDRFTKVAEESVTNTLTTHRAFNAALQTRRLTPIEERLKVALGLDGADVIRVPVFYDFLPMSFIDLMGAVVLDSSAIGGKRRLRTFAYTPCAANLQIFDNLALVPKPHGPRMRTDDVIKVMELVKLPGLKAADLPPTGSEQWVRAGTTTAALETTFGSTAAAIKGHARNAGKFTAAGAVKRNWDRIFIPEDTIDLLEAYMHVQLTKIGLTVHFIEDWDDYHAAEGEVHCGTNVRRTPAEADPNYHGPFWWDCESVRS